MTRWQIIRVLLIVAYRVLVKRDYLGLLRDLLPKEDTPATAPMKHHPSAMSFVPELRKMVRGGGAHLLVVLVLAGVAMAAGQITVTGFPPVPVTIKGGDGINIAGGVITATGVPAGGVTDNTFKIYTSVGGGRATNDRVDTVQNQVTAQAVGAALGATALQPDGDGSALTGITPAQIGAEPADSTIIKEGESGASLTGITPAQVGAATAAQGAKADDARPSIPAPSNVNRGVAITKYTTYAQFVSDVTALDTAYSDVTCSNQISAYFGATATTRSTAGGNNLYWCGIGDNTKPALHVFGELHGEEWRTTHALLAWANRIRNPANTADYAWAQKLLASYYVVLVPMVNPDGYFAGTRTNNNPYTADSTTIGAWNGTTYHRNDVGGVDLSRNFDYGWSSISDLGSGYGVVNWKGPTVFSEAESIFARDLMRNYPPVALYDFHETFGGADVTQGIQLHTVEQQSTNRAFWAAFDAAAAEAEAHYPADSAKTDYRTKSVHKARPDAGFIYKGTFDPSTESLPTASEANRGHYYLVTATFGSWYSGAYAVGTGTGWANLYPGAGNIYGYAANQYNTQSFLIEIAAEGGGLGYSDEFLSDFNQALLMHTLSVIDRYDRNKADVFRGFKEITTGGGLAVTGYGDSSSIGIAEGDKGDITVSGSGSTWTIDADSVALGTDTTGDYVSGATVGGALAKTGTEGATLGLAACSSGQIYKYNGSAWACAADESGTGGTSDHGSLTGLSDDDHSQYTLLAGRAGGQTIIGGTAAGNNLSLASTSNGTKGKVYLSGTSTYFDETRNSLGINMAAAFSDSSADVEIQADAGDNAQILLRQSNSASAGVNFIGTYSSGGSVGSPSTTQSGDDLLVIGSRGYLASQWASTSLVSIEFLAGETYTNSSANSYMVFKTTGTNAVSRSERMRITGSGNVGIGTTSPGAKLEVNGGGSVGFYPVNKSADATLTAAEVRNSRISNFGASALITLTLPTAGDDYNFLATVSAAQEFRLDPAAGDTIYLNDEALTAEDGEYISLGSTVGAQVACYTAITGAGPAYDWFCRDIRGVATEQD